MSLDFNCGCYSRLYTDFFHTALQQFFVESLLQTSAVLVIISIFNRSSRLAHSYTSFCLTIYICHMDSLSKITSSLRSVHTQLLSYALRKSDLITVMSYQLSQHPVITVKYISIMSIWCLSQVKLLSSTNAQNSLQDWSRSSQDFSRSALMASHMPHKFCNCLLTKLSSIFLLCLLLD